MRRKLFIGIGVDPDVAGRLKRKLEPFLRLPVTWTPEKNMHMTLLFLGYVDDDRLLEITDALSEACKGVEPFDAGLARIALVPDRDHPKMILAEGQASEELETLQKKIAHAFGTLTREKNAFHPHVTLGRVKRAKWKALKEKPDILEQDIRLNVPVSVVTLFESTVIDGVRDYLPIEVADLGY